MDLIRLFMGILLIICLILCINFKKLDETIRDHYSYDGNHETVTLFGLYLQDFKGKVRVADVLDYTPARQAGIEIGDRILEVDGHKIRYVKEFYELMENLHDKQKIKMLLYRVDSCSVFPVEVNNYARTGL